MWGGVSSGPRTWRPASETLNRRSPRPPSSGNRRSGRVGENGSAAIARGLPPWVIAEDATEELLTWDESSDFYRDTKQIKVESDIYINAALLFPHGIRKVKGA